MSLLVIIGTVLAAWALLTLVGNEHERRVLEVKQKIKAKAAAEQAAREAAE